MHLKDWAKQASITVMLSDVGNGENRFGADWETLIECFDDACLWWDQHDKAFQVILI